MEPHAIVALMNWKTAQNVIQQLNVINVSEVIIKVRLFQTKTEQELRESDVLIVIVMDFATVKLEDVLEIAWKDIIMKIKEKNVLIVLNLVKNVLNVTLKNV